MPFRPEASAPRLGSKAAEAWMGSPIALVYAYYADGEGAACPD
jgi:hypothetical protein